MELKSLRKADFITSMVVMGFGLFVMIMGFRMPMTASYGGVKNFWYIAPALFPLCIGGGLILMGAILCYVAVRDGGFRTFMEDLKEKTGKNIDEKTIRVWVILLALGSFIYLYIPRVDFFVSIAVFLFFICAVFYSESALVFRNLTLYYLAGSLVILILFATGLGKILIGLYPYTMDALTILFLVGMNFYARKLIKIDGQSVKKINTVMWISIITPLILCPIFRYPLLTPLPNEGIIMDHMNLIYYALKY